MTFRSLIICLAICTLISGGIWVFLLFTINPFEVGIVGPALFVAALSVALTGAFTVCGLWCRVYILKRNDVLIREVKISVRQALLLTCVCVIALILSAQARLHLWVLAALIGVASACEYMALLVQRSRRN